MEPDYRDRISVAVAGVAIALAATAYINLPARNAVLALGSNSIRLPVAADILAPLLIILLSGTGAEAVVRAHPLVRSNQLRLTLRFWALPVAVTAIALVLLDRAPSNLYWVAGLLAFSLLLAVVLTALYFSLDPDNAGYRRSRAVLNLVCYAIALLLFLLLPTDWSQIAQAAVMGAITVLLALELLHGTRGNASEVGLYAAILAVVMAQVAWALLLTGLSALERGPFITASLLPADRRRLANSDRPFHSARGAGVWRGGPGRFGADPDPCPLTHYERYPLHRFHAPPGDPSLRR